jgi:hypothetical protein
MGKLSTGSLSSKDGRWQRFVTGAAGQAQSLQEIIMPLP